MNTPYAHQLARALFAEAGDALFLFDPDTDQLLDVNPVAERLSGFPRQELLRLPATYLFRFGGQGGMRRLQQAAHKTAVFHSQEGFLLRTNRDGVWVPVNLTMARLHVQPKTLALITARDGREQREAHARLEKADAELRRVLASVSDCLWTAEVAANGRWAYRYFSPVVAKLTGRPPEFFLGDVRRWQDALHPDDRPRWEQALARLRSGQPIQEEYRVVWPDGTVRWLRDSVSVSRERADGPAACLRLDGVLTDVTERRLAEEALARERNLLRTLMDHLPDHVFIKDLHSRFVIANAATLRTLRAAALADVVGRTDRDFLPPELAEQFYADEQAVVRSGQPLFNREEQVIDAAGRRRWLLTSKLPLRDGGGAVVGLVGISHDITERKRAEEERDRLLAREEAARAEAEAALRARDESLLALRASEEQHRSLAEAIPQIVWTSRPDGWHDYYNRRWFDYTGLTAEQTRGWGWGPVLHPDDLRPCLDRWAEALRSGEPYENEYRLRRGADGAYRWHLGRAVPVRDREGRVVKWFGTCTDIDDRKRAAEAAQQAQKAAEAANRAKSDFLANMSHEIRTPMNGILGMTDLALGTDLTAEQREYLEMVKASADALLAIINDILDFSKIEAKKLHLDAVAFGLRDALGDTLRGLALRAQEKGLELACHVPPEVPDDVVGDPVRLRQVIVNLVGNAIKFTDRGEVVVEVKIADCRLQIADSQKDNLQSAICNLQFSVRDTGIGIPPDKQGLIFQAFAQADSSTTRRYGGTGLGLTISSHLVALMGGRIWVESAAGRGSTFHFTARFGLAPGPAARPAAGPVRLDGLPVLVVDDNATNRRILQELLGGWHMRPIAVDGGGAALAALRRAEASGEPFGLVLLDAHMPGEDGFAVAGQIRRGPGPAAPAVVMLTSAGLLGDVARCRELGIDAYLMKPVKPSDLLDVIVTALGQPAPGEGLPAPAALPSPRPTRPALRVLLAEDNAVNQKLAVRLLAKQGHSVAVAGNGREALAALEREPFDLVLMDVQMPEMDGLEATAHVRRAEGGGGRHVPIVAMTAHAMKGDRERCLRAGMDGYVSKPIQPQELFEVIDRLIPPPARGGPGTSSPPAPAEVLDRAEVLERVGGDVELLKELVRLFLDTWPGQLAAVRAAVECRDAAALHRAAHALKGAVGALGAPDACAAALRLETMGREGDLAHAEEACAALAEALARLQPALVALVEDGGNSSPERPR